MTPAALTFIANVRMPTEKAHGIQIVRMCEAFARTGLRTTLVHPRRGQPQGLRNVDPLDYYGVRTAFAVASTANVDVVRGERWLPAPVYLVAHNVHLRVWAAFAVRYAERHYPADLFMTRDISVAAELVTRGLPTVLEIHQVPERWSLGQLRRVASHASLRLMVTMTAALRDRLAASGVDVSRAMVLHDGVDLDEYEAAEQDVSWRAERPTVLYTGHLFPQKGVGTLVEAARHLPEIDVRIVGGMSDALARWQTRLAATGPANVRFLGYHPPRRLPGIQKGADVLVLPNSGLHPHSARDTSPMKLFEYMAAKRPIVASDVPALREVLTHDVNAWLVPADDPVALARGVRALLEDPHRAIRLASQARRDVERYTWTARAAAIFRNGARPASPENEALRC